MSAVCPKCGVAVVPGYVKCPKCQATLPQRRAITQAAGGTSVGGGGLSLPMIGLGVAALGVVIAVIAFRGGDKPPAVEPDPVVAPTEPVVADRPPEPDDTPGPAPVQTAAKDPSSAVRELERALKKERLWGTVELTGTTVDVRSATCPAMRQVLEDAGPALREGGVTKVRCREQAGAVVFEGDL